MKDKQSITYNNTSSNPCYEIYVWGTNTSFNLGIGHNNSKPVPTPLGTFFKKTISIKQVSVKLRFYIFLFIYFDNLNIIFYCFFFFFLNFI